MLAVRIFLAFTALLWTPYALFLLIDPAALTEAANVAATSPTGVAELRAMYGGLQAAVGLLALAGALRPAVAPYALVMLGVASAGLGVARLGAATIGSAFSQYTVMALALELGSLAIVLALWKRAQPGTSGAAHAA
ncbi:MAG: DUF4345 family protein [Deltaproteobacteria bacterium]|nr:DUF4345 family protein [Deltaproteobacteria bacterium]